MKSKILLLACAVLAGFVLTGCGTKSAYIQAPGAQAVNPADGFKVGQIDDLSGFSFKDGDEDAFDLKEAMAAALRTELARQGISADKASYGVNVNIMGYSPGNAFARWIMPGAGATRLSVEAMIVDKNGAQVARIPVERHISAGGGYTVGAYKYIFEEVAQEIAAVIKEPTKAKSGQSKQNDGTRTGLSF